MMRQLPVIAIALLMAACVTQPASQPSSQAAGAPATETAVSGCGDIDAQWQVNRASADRDALAQAAEGDDPWAQYQLGRLLEGDGDPAAAASLYREADSLSAATLRLGYLYLNGRGVPQDATRAAQAWLAAAQANNSFAQCELATLYAEGRGVARDAGEAYYWYTIAAANGNGAAGTLRDGLAVAGGGDAIQEAQYRIATAFRAGSLAPRDAGRAAAWYRRAAQSGYPYAQYELGRLYAAGDGVPLSRVQAWVWLDRAARNGNRFAAGDRDRVAERMSPAEIDEAQRQVRQL